MIKDILPPQFDNTFRASRLAFWLFIPTLIVKLLMGLNAILMGRMVARSADGIPLESFSPEAAETIVALFAIWGLAQLMIVSLGLLAVLRYRAMIPLLFAVLLLEHSSRKVILTLLPVARSGNTPPGTFVNIALACLLIAGLILSLWRKEASTREREPR